MKCIENIKDIALDCKYRPTKGLKHRVLVIPYKDIDRRYTAMNEDKSVITHFQLYPTKRGYLFELSNAFKVNGSQKLSGGFVHELSIKIDKANSDNIATMNALTKGAYVLVVETMSNTFEILGYDAGVVVSSIQRDYAGNVIGLTFATPSDVKELRMVALWGEVDYLSMSKKFENKALVRYNLLKGTKDFELKNEPYYLRDNYAGGTVIINETFRGNKVRKLVSNWQGFTTTSTLLPIPTIISFWAKTRKVGVKFYCTTQTNVTYINGQDIIPDGEWHKYIIYRINGIKTYNNGNQGFVEFYKNSPFGIEELYVSSFKIEYDKIGTDYSDFNISQFGVNLLLHSSVRRKNSDYRLWVYNVDEGIDEGEEVTVTLKGILGEGKRTFAFNVNGKTNLVELDSIGLGYWQKTTKWQKGGNNNELWLYVVEPNIVIDSEVEWIKLERGVNCNGFIKNDKDKIKNENFFINSNFINSDSISVSEGVEKINKNNEKLNEYHCHNGSWTTASIPIKEIENLLEKDVTISFDFKILSGDMKIPKYYQSEKTGYMDLSIVEGDIKLNEWIRVFKNFTFKDGYNAHISFIGMNGRYQLRNYKLELGVNPTDY